MKVLAVTLSLLLVSTAADAQTLGPLLDKAAVGAEGATFWPAELDGDPSTAEWIGMRYDVASDRVLYQAAILRQGQLCRGAFFDPMALVRSWISEVSVMGLLEVRGISMFVVQGMRYYRELGFALPECDQ